MSPISLLVAVLPLLATLSGAVPTTGSESLHQHEKRACSTRVNINTQRLNFLDYPAIQIAADDAVAEVERNRRIIAGTASEEDLHQPQKRALTCDRIRERKEWRTLTRDEQKAYIIAEKCLQTQPNFGLTNPTSGPTWFDAFTYIHQQDWVRFHGNAKFPPWHRWFVWMHGYSMEKLCNYTGPVPYWNIVRDADSGNVLASPIFSTDAEVGFGNSGTQALSELGGRVRAYKVDNGAFANFKPYYPQPHFLMRNYTPSAQYNPGGRYGPMLGQFYNTQALNRALGASDYGGFVRVVDGLDEAQGRSIHNAIHFANFGDGGGPFFLQGTQWFPAQSPAPNDPIFYMHHAGVDWIWWQYQQKGRTQQYDYRSVGGFGGGQDNICDKLPFTNMGPDVPVALSLKTEWYPMCYTYV